MPEDDPQLKSENITSSFDQAAIEEKYHCKIDLERGEQVFSATLSEYTGNELGFFQEKNQAEEEFINFLIEQGESSKFITTFIFLASMITFGSDSKI
ncbi:hypothetical protein KKA50_02830, partial [Patescibacteria group bacterium]|nr:hypothetical protein [Patescibacteria group bacterium]